MRRENVIAAYKAMEKLIEIEMAIKVIKRHCDMSGGFDVVFRTYEISLTPSCVVGDLQRQADKLKHTIKSLGVED